MKITIYGWSIRSMGPTAALNAAHVDCQLNSSCFEGVLSLILWTRAGCVCHSYE